MVFFFNYNKINFIKKKFDKLKFFFIYFFTLTSQEIL